MNRQYIGARYVPKFSDKNGGVWNNTYSYEALEIVKHGNDFYTSKKPVPTGVEITNTEYWALTGDYNGAISTLNDKIDEIENELNKTKPFSSDCDVMFIGDSWGVGGLADAINLKMGFNHYYKSSYGGSGFVATGDSPAIDKNFKKLFLDLCDTLTTQQKKNINYLIVAGGINDSDNAYISLIPAAIQDFIDNAVIELPNAQIYIMACNNMLHGTWTPYSYVNQYMSCQGYKNAIISDLTFSELITEHSNNGHLSAYSTIATAIISAIKGVPFGQGIAKKTVTVSYNTLGITDKEITFYQKNKNIYAYFQEWYFNGTFTFTGLAQVVGTLSDELIPYIEGVSLIITCNVKYQGDSNYTAVPVTLQIYNGQIILRVYGVYAGTITELSFPGIFELPILWA